MTSLEKNQNYNLLTKQIEVLLDAKLPLLTNLSNSVAAINQSFSQVSWVGFYLRKNNYLYLGPFQGNVACTKIEIGKGVCGTSLLKKETIIVENVNQFPGHIACDVESKSEIVIPIIKNNYVYGVLDLDSKEIGTFDETDRIWLEKFCDSLKKIIIEEKIKNLTE
ncbi:MAG: hypothetical protein CR986_05110 [Ignavibacteriae bacterium]|nr:MAG: hypothetical protein CR986_05110 [Ignavibacteriota bacterium]